MRPEYSRSSESSGRPFPGLLQLEKYFCTGVLESSSRPFPGLLQSVSAHVRYVESRSTLDQLLTSLARSLQVLSCTTQVLAAQLFRELWQTSSWNVPSSTLTCTSSSESSGIRLPRTFQWLSMLLPCLSSSCYSFGPASLHALTRASIQSS